MKNTYKNINIKTEKDRISIFAEHYIDFENLQDEQQYFLERPRFLNEIIFNNFPKTKYEYYYICTLFKEGYNKISDYKGIWKLAECNEIGSYQNSYLSEKGKIYFGISSREITSLDNIELAVPKGTKIPQEQIFAFFADNAIDLRFRSQCNIFSELAKVVEKSIVITEETDNGICLNLYGENVAKITTIDPLPHIIEEYQ